MKKHWRQGLDEDAEINLTPMLDVVFILLIFFLVTSSFVKESGVEVDRPGAVTAVRKGQGALMIAITRDNEIWIDRRRVEIGSVRTWVERLQAQNPASAVIIQADQAAAAGLLVQVIDQARRAGVADVAIAAEPIDD